MKRAMTQYNKASRRNMPRISNTKVGGISRQYGTNTHLSPANTLIGKKPFRESEEDDDITISMSLDSENDKKPKGKKQLKSLKNDLIKRCKALERRLIEKIDAKVDEQQAELQSVSEGLIMHATEVEAECLRMRALTNSRFKQKSEEYDKTLKTIRKEAYESLSRIKEEAKETSESLLFRLEDFTAMLERKVTPDYVEIMGKQIKSGIMDDFDRRNEDLLEKMRNEVNQISISQDQLTIETQQRLTNYRGDIGKFQKEIYEKATKLDFKKAVQSMEEIRAQFDLQYDMMGKELKASVSRIDKFAKIVITMQSDMKLRDEAFRKVPQNTQQLLKDLNTKMVETTKHVTQVDAKFEGKLDRSELGDLLSEKLDVE